MNRFENKVEQMLNVLAASHGGVSQPSLEKGREILCAIIRTDESFTTMLEDRIAESSEHVLNVHDMTRLMLERTTLGKGISEEARHWIAIGSVLHDIGKLAVPQEILKKRGPLTPQERAVMQTHTTMGANMLARYRDVLGRPLYDYARNIALQHHERWLGDGYPNGLKGDAISPWAQIVSLADVYDALMSLRVYKPAFSREKTLAMIGGGECGSFNPVLLDEFLALEPEIYEKLYAHAVTRAVS